MAKKTRKDPFGAEQRAVLKELHTTQVTLEIALTVLFVTILTINIASVVPGYGIFVFVAGVLAALVSIVFGIILSITAHAKSRMGNPLIKRTNVLRRWLIAVWVSISVVILLFIFNSPFKDGEFNTANLYLIGSVAVIFAIAVIASLVSSQLIWRRFNNKKRSPRRIISYGALAAGLFLLAIFGSYTTQEVVMHNKTVITDANLELGQSEVRQAGRDGEKKVQHSLLFGFEISSETSETTDEITAKGSRKYQYMYCSDGSYRYYSAEEFKNPNTGFTHQSPDYCAQNGNGTQTTIADVPPAEKIVQQVPTYNYYTPRSYTTTCNSYSFSNSVTCRTY